MKSLLTSRYKLIAFLNIKTHIIVLRFVYEITRYMTSVKINSIRCSSSLYLHIGGTADQQMGYFLWSQRFAECNFKNPNICYVISIAWILFPLQNVYFQLFHYIMLHVKNKKNVNQSNKVLIVLCLIYLFETGGSMLLKLAHQKSVIL